MNERTVDEIFLRTKIVQITDFTTYNEITRLSILLNRISKNKIPKIPKFRSSPISVWMRTCKDILTITQSKPSYSKVFMWDFILVQPDFDTVLIHFTITISDSGMMRFHLYFVNLFRSFEFVFVHGF